jgi:hypothetical protein
LITSNNVAKAAGGTVEAAGRRFRPGYRELIEMKRREFGGNRRTNRRPFLTTPFVDISEPEPELQLSVARDQLT